MTKPRTEVVDGRRVCRVVDVAREAGVTPTAIYEAAKKGRVVIVPLWGKRSYLTAESAAGYIKFHRNVR